MQCLLFSIVNLLNVLVYNHYNIAFYKLSTVYIAWFTFLVAYSHCAFLSAEIAASGKALLAMTMYPKLSLRANAVSAAIPCMEHAQPLSISHAGDCFGHKCPRNDRVTQTVIASERSERGNLIHGTRTVTFHFSCLGLLRAQVPSQ